MVPNPIQLAELAIEKQAQTILMRYAKSSGCVFRELSWEDTCSARRFKLGLSVVPWRRGGFQPRKTSKRFDVEPLQVDRGRFPGLGSGRTRFFPARGYLTAVYRVGGRTSERLGL
jgi:hypothetical protein